MFEKGKPAMKLDVSFCIFNRKMLDPRNPTINDIRRPNCQKVLILLLGLFFGGEEKKFDNFASINKEIVLILPPG